MFNANLFSWKNEEFIKKNYKKLEFSERKRAGCDRKYSNKYDGNVSNEQKILQTTYL
jgi:hypothetical protein